MTKTEFSSFLGECLDKIESMWNHGNEEYAHSDDVFANFQRLSERMGIDRKKVLMVYLEKHIDGIHSYLSGVTSQREDVRGRILDAIVYLLLLWGMVDDNCVSEKPNKEVVGC